MPEEIEVTNWIDIERHLKMAIFSLQNGSTRVDSGWNQLHFTAYWTGSVLRIDIKGLESKRNVS